MDIEEYKTENYKKNDNLEYLLAELNGLLESVKIKEEVLSKKSKLPIIFIVGAPRSGTTLLTQWLASLNLFSYPSNFISRFHKLPYLGFLIQKMIFEPQFQYKNELNIKIASENFSSDVGKTTGALEPHEFWYFWRNYFTFPEIPVSNNDFLINADFEGFKAQISLIQNFNNSAFFIKSLIINWYIESFHQHIDNCLFIYIKRNEADNAKSLLKIRKKYLGDDDLWFSFKPKEYDSLKELDKYHQVAGQVHYINQTIEKQLLSIPDNKKLTVNYEDFCNNPELIYNELANKLEKYSLNIPIKYSGTGKFKISNESSNFENEIANALRKIKNY